MEDYEQFLRDVFAFKDPTHYIQIWLLKDRGTRRFQDGDKAASFVENHSEEDVYVCVGLTDEDLGLYRRGKESDIVALTGLVVEADFARIETDKGPLPTKEQALGLIEEMPHPASAVSMSGHGYHAWWLFKEPWLIESPAEREEVKELSMQWSGMFKAMAKEQGFVVDSVFDLTRVMRIPGTLNVKDPDAPVRSHIVATTDWRAPGLQTFRDVIREDLLAPRYAFEMDEDALVGEGFTLDPHAEAPYEKRQVLEANDEQFRDTLAHDRTDLNDESPSGYDMSAATQAAAMEWEPQEIVDLLIEMRRRNGVDLKLDRPDYYKRTVAKALRFVEREQAANSIPNIDTGDDDPMERIAQILRKPIDRIIKTPGPEGAVYALEYNGRTHELGDIRNIMSQTFFRRRWADISRIILKKRKSAWWDSFAQLLLNQCVVEDIGEEASLASATCARVEEYISHRKPAPEGEIVGAIGRNDPFYLNDTIAVTTKGLQRFLEWEGLSMSRRQIALGFRRAGFRRETYAYAQEGMSTSRSIWLLPDELAIEIMEVLENEESDELEIEEWM